MRRWIRGLFGFLGIAMGALVVGALLPGGKEASFAGPKDQEVWLVRGPIHTDFFLRLTPDTREAFRFAALPPETGWIIVGWGSEAFYTATGSYTDLSFRTVWRAATGDSAVLRVLAVPVTALPPSDWANQRLSLNEGQLNALRKGVAAEVTGQQMTGVHLSTDQDLKDAFFPARGRFDILRTCNQWAGRQLRDVGIRVGPFTPTTGGLRFSHWWHGEADL